MYPDCKRKDFISAAYIEAGILLERKRGTAYAEQFLSLCGINFSVTSRVLGFGILDKRCALPSDTAYQGMKKSVSRHEEAKLTTMFIALGVSMENDQRADSLTAQKIDVALVLHKMLGVEEAEGFLKKNHILPCIIERILYSDAYRIENKNRVTK